MSIDLNFKNYKSNIEKLVNFFSNKKQGMCKLGDIFDLIYENRTPIPIKYWAGPIDIGPEQNQEKQENKKKPNIALNARRNFLKA